MNHIEEAFLITLFPICLGAYNLFSEFGILLSILGTLLVFIFGVMLINAMVGDKRESVGR